MARRPWLGSCVRGAFNVDTISSYESQVKNSIFQVFNGVETEVEAMVFANYAMRQLKESQNPKFSRETSTAFINLLAEMLHREMHSIYGSQVIDYSLDTAVTDAKICLQTERMV